jgi:hypothetical protein
MTEEYKYGREINVEHMTNPTCTEDAYVIREADLSAFEKFLENRKDSPEVVVFEDFDMLVSMGVDITDDKAVSKLTDRFYGTKAQERILKHGSLRMKVAMKRARRHDGDKNNRKPFLGEIRGLDLAFEVAMLRCGATFEERHPKNKFALNAHDDPKAYKPFVCIDSEGVKKDIRDLDYLTLLKMASSDVKQEFGRIARVPDDNKA